MRRRYRTGDKNWNDFLNQYPQSDVDKRKVCNKIYRTCKDFLNSQEVRTSNGLRKDFKKIEKLERNHEKYGVAEWLGVWRGPIGLIYQLYPVWATHILKKINVLIYQCIVEYKIEKAYWNDFIRAVYKCISKVCSEGEWLKELEDIRIAKIFVGLHTMGGPQPYDKEEIIKEVNHWIGQGSVKLCAKPKVKMWAKNKIQEIIREWVGKMHDTNEHILTFEEYCDDITRWATPGGASRVTIGGEKYRNKWAWGYYYSKEYNGISKWYKHNYRKWNVGYVNRVALKEESGKTRSIIATPMTSHIRQSYLYYVLGPAPIKSTLTDGGHLFNMMSNNWAWFGALDASEFDHNIPKWLILYVFSTIRYFRPDLSSIINDEIDYIENSVVELFGQEIKYRNGFLSGWKWTSLLGSLISMLTSEWIKLFYNIEDYCVQGDDIILVARNVLSGVGIVKTACDFGVNVNISKCMFGEAGEFLKKIYSKNQITSYPARAIRSIFYANPWVDNFQFNDPKSIVNSWWTLVSRLIPYQGEKVIYRGFELVIDDLYRWSRRTSKSSWRLFLRTPSSCGGGAPLDICNLFGIPSELAYCDSTFEDTKPLNMPQREANLTQAMGIVDNRQRIIKREKINIIKPLYFKHQLNGENYQKNNWEGKNRFKSYLMWNKIKWYENLAGETFRKNDLKWPRWLNIRSSSKCIEYDMSGSKFGICQSLTCDGGDLGWQMRDTLSAIERWCYSRHHKPDRSTNVYIGLSIYLNCQNVKTNFCVW